VIAAAKLPIMCIKPKGSNMHESLMRAGSDQGRSQAWVWGLCIYFARFASTKLMGYQTHRIIGLSKEKFASNNFDSNLSRN